MSDYTDEAAYYDEKAAPKREDRLGATTAFGGTGCQLKKKWGCGCMQHNTRGFCQGSICQLLPGASILSTIPDSVLIFHGAIGCGGPAHQYNASIRSRQISDGCPNPPGGRWMSTNLTEADVVSGGEAKLRAAILEADRQLRPSAIFAVTTCAPGIIGDDIDGLVANLQPLVGARIIPIHCEGFKTGVMATAYDSIYHGVIRFLLDDEEVGDFGLVDPELAEAQDKVRRSRWVNLMNVGSMGEDDEAELSRLLVGLGLEPRIFPCYAHPEDFRLATQAALSVSTCPTHDDYFLKALRQRFGVPYIIQQMPIGVGATSSWIRAVAEFFHVEEQADRLIENETGELEAALAPLRPALEGKTAVISAGEVRTIATAVLLKELGMKVLTIRPYHFDEFGLPALDALEKAEPEAQVNIGTVQPFETVNLLLKNRPDIYIGHVADNVWAAKSGIPTLPIYGGPNTYMGFKGVFDLARRLARVLSNPTFNRNLARHTRHPYRDKWLQDDPYRFIVEPVEEFAPEVV